MVYEVKGFPTGDIWTSLNCRRFATQDLRAIDVDVVTFGQYLRPTENHLSVVEYVKPEKFEYYRQVGEHMGFKYVASGPMVRSSYKAGEFYLEHMIESERKEKQ